MKQKVIVGWNGVTYNRLTKPSAKKAFESGKKVYVMSIDRNPINSLTSPHKYYIGCKSICGWFNGKERINTFDDLLEDFRSGLTQTDMVTFHRDMMQSITDFPIG